MLQNYRLFTVKYISPTNHNGARVSIKDCRYDKSVTIPFNYELNSVTDMATKFLISKGIALIGACETSKGNALITQDFQTQIK